MQILPNQMSVPGSFQDSFNTGLQQLLQIKLGQMQQKQQARQMGKAFEALGVPTQQARYLGGLHPSVQKELVKQGMLPTAQDILQPQSFEQNQMVQQALQAAAPTMTQEQQQITQPQAYDNQQLMPQQQIQPMQQQQAQIQQEPVKNAMQKPIDTARMTPIQRAQARKIELENIKNQREEQKLAIKEQHTIDKELRPVYNEMIKESRGAKDDDRRLDRMQQLVLKGDLSRPRWHSILNTLEHGIFGFGVNLHSLESADSQEFDKLSKEFLKNAQNVFGSRITDNDVRVFLKMVPDLSQSREGKLAIIHNMKMYNEGIHVRKNAADAIIKANGGKLPRDLEAQIERVAGPQLDQLSKKFVTEERFKSKPVEQSFFSNPLDILFGQG